jgi:hypothetical protein
VEKQIREGKYATFSIETHTLDPTSAEQDAYRRRFPKWIEQVFSDPSFPWAPLSSVNLSPFGAEHGAAFTEGNNSGTLWEGGWWSETTLSGVLIGGEDGKRRLAVKHMDQLARLAISGFFPVS